MKRFLSSCDRLPRVVFSIGVAALLASLAVPARAVTIDMVTVGNAGNANDPATGNLYGGVNYSYQIGRYDVTIGQYTDFLNAVAATDTYGLYSDGMAIALNVAGIAQSGSSGSYTYSVIAASGSAPNGGVSAANRPITYMSWWRSARFSNWMANGQPSGAQDSTTTENGAYNVNGATSGNAPAKNVTNPNTLAAPTFYIPTENEFYKAAFYSPVLNSGSGGYYTYATQSNTAPGNQIGGTANQANYAPGRVYSVTQSSYSASQNYLTDVGAFSGSGSFYCTFDQSGNVFQWNDLNGTSGSSRGVRGGSWSYTNPFDLSSSGRYSFDTEEESEHFGFRLASPVAVPEPSTWVMAAGGLACAGWGAWRRRRAR
jgi:formylglycine-generating enzyme required for sulfatase activity